MEDPCVEQFISSIAQSLEPGYPELISKFNFSECRKEIDLLLNDRYGLQTASKGPLLSCLLLNFHRQTSLAFQSKAPLEKEVETLRAQNASLLHEVQIASKEALRYLEDLHSAESALHLHKEELFKLRSERFSSPQTFHCCDSGYSDSLSSHSDRLTPSPSDTDSELGSYTSPQCSAPSSLQPLMHNTVISACPTERGARKLQNCPASSLHSQESEVSCSVPASPPERTVAHGTPVHSDVSSVSPSQKMTSQCPRLEELELIAKDMEHFDPGNPDQHIDDYFTELENNLVDLPDATHREKVKLVWKTSSKVVHKFIQTQPPSVRNNYQELRHALKEEFSSTADEAHGMFAALQIRHSRLEHPRDYYNRLRYAYFQGKNAPGLEENPFFKSLFLQNLHPCVRTHVVLSTLQDNPSLHELRKITQQVWETVVLSKAKRRATELVSPQPVASQRSTVPKHHPQPRNRTKGGDKRMHRDTERNRHVHHMRRDGHSHRSRRMPYADILAQNYDQQVDRSEDDISDCSSQYGNNFF